MGQLTEIPEGVIMLRINFSMFITGDWVGGQRPNQYYDDRPEGMGVSREEMILDIQKGRIRKSNAHGGQFPIRMTIESAPFLSIKKHVQ